MAFLGTPVFTDDDHSGTFVQRTLYRFTVQEIYKGLPSGTHEVWIDPGSYTSCYAEYKIGVQYLMFASRGGIDPSSFVAMTVTKSGNSTKPLPPGFNRNSPPPVYYAPECTGREVGYAPGDVEFLRSWVKGDTRTRAYGRVLERYEGVITPRPLSEVTITVNGNRNSTVRTDSEGDWSVVDLPAGKYTVTAAAASYSPRTDQLEIEPLGCAYRELGLAANGSITGKVLDQRERPVPGIPLQLARLGPAGELDYVYPYPSQVSEGRTDGEGKFQLVGLPAGDFAVGVNLADAPSRKVPYPTSFAPGVPNVHSARFVHLSASGRQDGVELRLLPRFNTRIVRVKVVWPDGRPVAKATVWANVGKYQDAENANTDDHGVLNLKCLAGVDYTLTAFKWIWHTKSPQDARRADATPVPLSATARSATLVLRWPPGKTQR